MEGSMKRKASSDGAVDSSMPRIISHRCSLSNIRPASEPVEVADNATASEKTNKTRKAALSSSFPLTSALEELNTPENDNLLTRPPAILSGTLAETSLVSGSVDKADTDTLATAPKPSETSIHHASEDLISTGSETPLIRSQDDTDQDLTNASCGSCGLVISTGAPSEKGSKAGSVDGANAEFKEPVLIKSINLPDHHVYNDFEKAVFSGLGKVKATIMSKFFLTEKAAKNFATEFQPLAARWKSQFRIENGNYPSTKALTMIKGHHFEVDCFATVEEATNLLYVLRGVILNDETNVFPLKNGIALRDIELKKNDCFLFEITQPQSDLPKKLYQIERTLRLQAECFPSVGSEVKAAAVVVNGDKNCVENAVGQIILYNVDATLKINQIPVFVIYSPYRNVYSELASLSNGVKELKTEVKELKTEVKQLNQTQFLAQMSEGELEGECAKFAITVSGLTRYQRLQSLAKAIYVASNSEL